MDLFIQNIPPSATKEQVKVAIANVVHGPEYRVYPTTPMNLEVTIFRRARNDGTKCGVVTLPSVEVAEQFLRSHGPSSSNYVFVGRRLTFGRSNKPPRPHIVEEVSRLPYVDPRIAAERELRSQELRSGHRVNLAVLQFGWECRDNVFSVEWERSSGALLGDMEFDDTRREFRVYMDGVSRVHIAVIRVTHIVDASCAIDGHGTQPVIYLSLTYPPTFESDIPRNVSPTLDPLAQLMQTLSLTLGPSLERKARQRHPFFHQSQHLVAPYTSTTIRIVCKAREDLHTFRHLCRVAHIRCGNWVPPVEHRRLFSEDTQARFTDWLLSVNYKVAFQLEAIVRKLLADPIELLSCRDRIERMILDRDEPYSIAFLRYFATKLGAWLWFEEGEDENRPVAGSIEELFSGCESSFTYTLTNPLQATAVDPLNLFECLHVTVTPTGLILEGPYPERSNRVMRSYPHNQDSFLRVCFAEENKLQFRLDQEVDGRKFIKERFGEILRHGLEVGGRHFDFLAYSQSALKEHAVWFVKPFVTPQGDRIDAASIIASLGDFTQPDPDLVKCPARYAARISQAFTATDASTTVEAEEIIKAQDIFDAENQWNFTDGVGTISREMARAIWGELRRRRRRLGNRTTYPRAYQIRFQGSKGMLSIDHKLQGKVIVLRPSMIKFEAPQSTTIEIARAFDKPGPFYLNRPLIMILEQLGVPCTTFEDLQESAVRNAQHSVESFERAGRLLEAYGLGQSYKLYSVMISLEKLSLSPISLGDPFYRGMMDFAVNHVLRELKYHARIPVENAWNLVGVADVHGYLNEGEVFIHVVPTNGDQPFYFEGRTLISRSPTIHPGDVQIVHAIGPPPPDSPFAIESLRNCVVFSINGMSGTSVMSSR